MKYQKIDDHHFNLTATVEISNHFFAWLMRFGRGAILQSPEPVIKEFTDYLDTVRALYKTNADD